jgi:nitrate/nitrite-specific signal transduction histidine kinase
MQERAALLGGEVRFTGAPGHGTLVTARLPQRASYDTGPPTMRL